jgi:hypothetical protein
MNLIARSILSDFQLPKIFRRLIMMRLALTFVCWGLMTGLAYPQPDVSSGETSSSQAAVSTAAPAAATTPEAVSQTPVAVADPQATAAETPAAAKPTTTGAAVPTGQPTVAKVDKKPKTVVTKPVKKGVLQLDHLYVVEGCEACNGLQSYLRRVGVKLTISRVGNSPYSTFPTVVYSDGTTDNGERVYSKTCQFPKSVAVDECRSGG